MNGPDVANVMIVGASSGLGAACAYTFARAGYRVLALSRRIDLLRTLVRGLPEGKSPHEALVLDVTDPSQVERVAQELLEKRVSPQILLYCAGTGQFAPVEECSDEVWTRLMAVNVTGAFRVISTMSRLIPEGGKIVLVSSTASVAPFANGGAYCASKAALNAFASCLRQELRPRRIAVSLILPGTMATPFWGNGEGCGAHLRAGEVAELIRAVAQVSGDCEVSDIIIRPLCES